MSHDPREIPAEADVDEARRASASLIERFRNAPDRGIGGRIDWTRDDVYDRRLHYEKE